jgi:hypothetical protein
MLFVALAILRTGMGVGLILTGSLQCGRSGHPPRGCFFVPQEIFVRIPICTGRFEEIQGFFGRLVLNGPGFAKYGGPSLARTKKFMDEDHVIAERVSQSLIDHLGPEVFPFADPLLDFTFDGGGF